jgi:hypothetical protein
MKYIVGLIAGIGLIALAGQADASVFLGTLNVIDNTAQAPQGTAIGTVQVSDNIGGGVTVDVELKNNFFFVDTGSHVAFAYFLDTTITSPAVNITTPGSAGAPFTVTYGTPSNSPFGSFTDGMECAGCGPGSTHKNAGPLIFTIAGVTTGDFKENSSNYYFAADISDLNGHTGAVGSNSFVMQPGVPEPSSWAMIILGFAGIGFVAYRRKDQGSAFRIV